MHVQRRGHEIRPTCHAVQVLCNVMKSHVAAYDAMKALPGCDDLQIGLVHHHVEFMPSDPKWFWVRPLCWWGNFWWGRDTVLNFLRTGRFEWWVPLCGKSAPFTCPMHSHHACPAVRQAPLRTMPCMWPSCPITCHSAARLAAALSAAGCSRAQADLLSAVRGCWAYMWLRQHSRSTRLTGTCRIAATSGT
jgi:hypothetical protein